MGRLQRSLALEHHHLKCHLTDYVTLCNFETIREVIAKKEDILPLEVRKEYRNQMEEKKVCSPTFLEVAQAID